MASGKREARHRIADILYREQEHVAMLDCTCGLHLDANSSQDLCAQYVNHTGVRENISVQSLRGGYRPGERL